MTTGSPSDTGAVVRFSNHRTPVPSSTGTRSTWIASSRPASRHCRAIFALATTTFLSPAVSRARPTAVPTEPAKAKDSGPSAGGSWVTTTTGTPSGWVPPQPWVMSYRCRPATSAPTPAIDSRMYAALAGDMRNVAHSTAVGTSTSPLPMQPNSLSIPSAGSAMNPSSDIDMLAMTLLIVVSPCLGDGTNPRRAWAAEHRPGGRYERPRRGETGWQTGQGCPGAS